VLAVFVVQLAQAQLVPPKFGKGLNFYGADSSFHIKFGFRFQNLYNANWTVAGDELNNIQGYDQSFLIRRSRLKFNGFAFSPKVKWKLELALTNRDISGGATPEFRNANNVVLDAWVDWNFYKGFSVRFGQGKLPGNVERVVSSANLQLVDRSLLNSKFNIDRDVGVQLWHKHNLGGNFYMKEKFAYTQGEGRNITEGSFGGNGYTWRVEFFPLGLFIKGKDEYTGSDIKRHERPRLMLAATYDINDNSVRTQGRLKSFIQDASGDYVGKRQNTAFIDAVYKHKGFSFMGEYANKTTPDGNPDVLDTNGNTLATLVTGSAINLQAGQMLNRKVRNRTGDMEIVGRYTAANFDSGNDEKQYTVGFNRFISNHQLKIQTDLTYRAIDGKDDGLMFRTQVDVHF